MSTLLVYDRYYPGVVRRLTTLGHWVSWADVQGTTRSLDVGMQRVPGRTLLAIVLLSGTTARALLQFPTYCSTPSPHLNARQCDMVLFVCRDHQTLFKIREYMLQELNKMKHRTTDNDVHKIHPFYQKMVTIMEVFQKPI
ncbi:hypothetical protein CBL_07120 [Carabus blaptoides fortunei]